MHQYALLPLLLRVLDATATGESANSGVSASSGAAGDVKLPKDASFTVELMKKIFKTNSCRELPFLVQSAVHAGIPMFILDHILGVSPESIQHVVNSAALRIHAVDTLKAMIAADEMNAATLQALLDAHHAWSEYKHQSHDLFLTIKEQTDHYLIEDASERRFVGNY